ncbi:coenzyme 420-dependent octopine/nopaline dehydrogenase [Nitzschia inconspicua]|uniref:Coenzyme 420-dependent octopine/nopaline dehydrogenase n=1 Tax=Nitzschia inconspicua TaxID=303405 RepID=A0A9K3Q0U8_9STRA|nr:coenzyme 420-dependent octopine/nopaline dehydrogenase [Nitzschia inconspicua]
MLIHRCLLTAGFLAVVTVRLCGAFLFHAPTRMHRKIVGSGTDTVTSSSTTSYSHLRAVDNDFTHQGGEKFQVGIAGAGAVAFATAAILSKNGHDVMLWSPSGRGTKDLHANLSADSHVNQRTDETFLTASGAMDYHFVPRIAASSEQLVNENQVVLICLPANGHKHVFDELAPQLSISPTCKHVIISSHASLGALYLTKAVEQYQQQTQLKTKSKELNFPTITAWGTTVCTARRPSGTTVDVKSKRKSVDLCTIPEQELPSALKLCQSLFPHTNFQPRDGLLAISLSNLNPQNHLGMALGNISRMDKGEAWYQFQMTTPAIGRFLQDLDQERLEIARALGLDVKTIYEHFSLSFHVPISESISDMCQQIHKSGNDVYGPNTPSSRYITEDVPFGLVLTATLGRMVGRPALLHESGIMICNSMYGCDFVAKNDLLQALKLDEMTLEELQRAIRTGRNVVLDQQQERTPTSVK